MSILYRCDGYKEEICGDCEHGRTHKDIGGCTEYAIYCPTIQKTVECFEYDRDPCGDPKCCDCFGGDGVSCKE